MMLEERPEIRWGTLRVASAEVARFANWSGDVNPLHVSSEAARMTYFRRPIAHGILSVLRTLSAIPPTDGPPCTLDVEFRGAVYPDTEYSVGLDYLSNRITARVFEGTSTVLAVRATFEARDQGGPRRIGQVQDQNDRSVVGRQDSTLDGRLCNGQQDASPPVESRLLEHRSEADGGCFTGRYGVPRNTVSQSFAPGRRTEAYELNPDTLHAGYSIEGAYRIAEAPWDDYAGGVISGAMSHVLGLCSYLVGMELPGLRSLFTRLRLQFTAICRLNDTSLGDGFHYRMVVSRYDPQLRMLDVAIEVTSVMGYLLACGTISSYVRFSPLLPDVEAIAETLGDRQELWVGNIAVVCGAGRGLGADLAAALALKGCRVFGICRNPETAETRALQQRLAAHNRQVTFLAGDIGIPESCARVRDEIVAACGRVDILVLNACDPPTAIATEKGPSDGFDEYLLRNIRMVRYPLQAFLPQLEKTNGAVLGISSSFVESPPAGFEHYVAVKQATEGILRVASADHAGVCVHVARPPRLLTSWNDVPTGVLHALPTHSVAVDIVKDLKEARTTGGYRVLSEFSTPTPRRPLAPRPVDGPKHLITLAATFTIQPLLDGLQFWAREFGKNLDVEIAHYGQVVPELLNAAGVLASVKRSIGIVLIRVADWMRELAPDQLGSPDFLKLFVTERVNELEQAAQAHAERGSGNTLVILCPTLHQEGFDSGLIAQAESELRERLGRIADLEVVDAAQFHSRYGVDPSQTYDAVRNQLGHMPYRDAYYDFLATVIARLWHRRLRPVRKVVVVDCDNTLWRGVVGEVGPEGVQFRDEHRRLHTLLNRLVEHGMLVCLCSKNVEQDVWSVFEQRPELVIRRDNVLAEMINWRPKSENLRALASRLNLGLDSFIFVDDNPIECAEVRSECPGVLIVQWPLDSQTALRILDHTWEFDVVAGTTEDQQRVKMYRDEFQRQELRQETLGLAEFLEKLKIQITIDPLADADLARVAQLTFRTNQFNFTTRRRSEAELRELVADPAVTCWTVRVSDRLGDYGLVGVLITREHGQRLEVDTFLLSCRVLGRGVEYRLLNHLGEIAASAGIGTVWLRTEATERNTPARDFLKAVAPGDRLHCEGAVLEYDFDSEYLRALVFDPDKASTPEVEAEGSRAKDERTQVNDLGSAGGTPAPQLNPTRERERQIQRAASDLFDVQRIHRAIRRATETTPSAQNTPTEASANVREWVCGVFSRALDTPRDVVERVDRLDVLGCDSFKIVEITVTLLERFPQLSTTLLFEHQTVLDVANAIQAHVGGAGEVAPRAAAISSDAARSGRSRPTDVAVVGIEVKCGGADSVEAFWQLLRDGKSAVRRVPPRRPTFLGQLPTDRPHYASLVDDADHFDPQFFGISPREASLLDPQLRLFLEVAWDAVEDAGLVAYPDAARTGVFVGVMYGDYVFHANLAAERAAATYRCWEGFSLANRLSQILGFQGPSFAVNTACSSSATAIHLACRALADGECQAAVVGGVNLILDPNRFSQLGRLGILSPSGRCRPFGAEADGTVLGEGAGVIVLRPLDEAIRRGDRIYGVIKGTGLSHGTGTVGFTAPNPTAQAQAIRLALKVAGIDPRTISFVETHGTGTSLGDPIEVRGLELAYLDADLHRLNLSGRSQCAIGALKPNIGHLEAGAGVLGLIKVLLQMQHALIAPTITSDEPNPQIAFGRLPFQIQRHLEPWRRPTFEVDGQEVDVPRRAGLSSFGVGGANVHIVVEEAPSVPEPALPNADRTHHVLAISARGEQSLRELARRLADRLRDPDAPELANVCYSANARRKHFEERIALVAGGRDEMAQVLDRVADGQAVPGSARGCVAPPHQPPKVAMLFTGQGAQFPGMGRSLYETHPHFREVVDRCTAILDPLLPQPLLSVMFAEEGTDQAALIHHTAFTQPALFVVEYALADLYRSWGVVPDVVAGHSIGEIAAMCFAGGMSLEDGLALVASRGRLMQALPAGGAMMAVQAAEVVVREAIAGYESTVSIAAVNGPQQSVISGAEQAVVAIAKRLTSQGVVTKRLIVSHAFHSPLLEPMLADLRSVAEKIAFSPPTCTVVAGVTGQRGLDDILSPNYWVEQARCAVRFHDVAMTMAQSGSGAFVEVGPQPVLLGAVRSCLPDYQSLYLPSMRTGTDPWNTLLVALGELHVNGVAVDWKAFDAPYVRRNVRLPRYPLQRQRYWFSKGEGDVLDVPCTVTTPDSPDADLLLYALQWVPKLGVGPSEKRSFSDVASGCVLVHNESHGSVVSALKGAFAERGITTVVVTSGEAYRRQDNGMIRLRFESKDDWEQLWSDLANRSFDVGHVVYVPGGSKGSPSIEQGQHLVADTVDQAVPLLRLVQSLGSSLPEKVRAKVWVVTRNATPVDGDGNVPLDIRHGALWGIGRTASLEFPEIWGGMIDVPLSELGAADRDPLETARQVVGHVVEAGGEDQITLRGGTHWVARFVRSPAGKMRSVPLRPDGVWLVTGGTGALGRRVAQWLVDKGIRHVVLASRRGELDLEGSEAVARWREAGAKVMVVSADVARRDDVHNLLSQIDAGGLPLRGVVHCAGVDRPMALAAMQPGDIREVLDAKVGGAVWLDRATRDRDLDAFVCFSSAAAVWGASGRAHYAAANAALDTLVHDRRRAGLPSLSVNWGPWRGGGMADQAALQLFERIGNRGLDPESAIHAMEILLADKRIQGTVVDVDWPRFRSIVEARRARRLFDLVESATDITLPRDTGGADPPFGTGSGYGRGAGLIDVLRAELAGTLGMADAASVPINRPFGQLGLDSLLTVEFVTRVRKRLGVPLSPAIFAYGHLGALAEAIEGQVADAASTSASQPTSDNAGEVSSRSDVNASMAPTAPDMPSGNGKGTIQVHEDMEARIVEFSKRAWPGRREDWILPRWRWMFVESARRLGLAPKYWAFTHENRIIAFMGAIPVRLRAGDVVTSASWLVDTMVLEEHRSEAYGARLMLKAGEDLPFSLSLGQTAQMRDIMVRLGWRNVAPLETYVLPLDPWEMVRHKFSSAPVAQLGATALRVSTAARRWFASRAMTRLDVRPFDKFEARHDAFWSRVGNAYSCAVVRDASYLNWKYVDQPGQNFLRLDCWLDGELVGVAVLSFSELDDTYPYRRAYLVEILVNSHSTQAVVGVLEAAREQSLARDAGALVLHIVDSRIARVARRFGFVHRGVTRFLLVGPGPAPYELAPHVEHGAKWFITMGDSDIDRPW